MISSTMMNGATRSLARSARTIVEPATMAASHAQLGTLPSALPKLDLGEAAGDLSRLDRARRDADVGRSLADLPQHRVVHRAAAGRALECCGIELRNTPDVVLAASEVGRCGAHLLANVWTRDEELERRRQRLHLDVVVGDL